MKKRYDSCILATACIPWTEKGELAEEIFRRELRNLAQNLTPHIYLFGTAGEGYAVTDKQFDQVTGIFGDEMGKMKARPMVGVISLSLGTILERIARAREQGIRYFQISLPSWGALNERELFSFFEKVCGGFPDCSFLHYNLMRTKRLITPEEYGKLAREFPNLVATKNSTDSLERITGLLKEAPELQHFFTEPGYAQGALLDECGFLISVASIHFKLGRVYFETGQKREAEKMKVLQQEMKGVIDILLAATGGTAHMDGAFDKMFCKIQDAEFPLRLLPPYSSFTDETFQKFLTLLREKHPRWLK